MARGTKDRGEAWRKRVALWRYEQIADLLPATVSRSARAELIRHMAERPVAWPSGKIEPIPSASAYRWVRFYRKGGLLELEPRIRSDRGNKRARLPHEVNKRVGSGARETGCLRPNFCRALPLRGLRWMGACAGLTIFCRSFTANDRARWIKNRVVLSDSHEPNWLAHQLD